jgi:hypothetical protein
VLRGLERPLLATSVHVEAEAGALEIPEAAVMMDQFAGRGLDFVVDCGTRVRSLNPAPADTALGRSCAEQAVIENDHALSKRRLEGASAVPCGSCLCAGGQDFDIELHQSMMLL